MSFEIADVSFYEGKEGRVGHMENKGKEQTNVNLKGHPTPFLTTFPCGSGRESDSPPRRSKPAIHTTVDALKHIQEVVRPL